MLLSSYCYKIFLHHTIKNILFASIQFLNPVILLDNFLSEFYMQTVSFMPNTGMWHEGASTFKSLIPWWENIITTFILQCLWGPKEIHSDYVRIFVSGPTGSCAWHYSFWFVFSHLLLFFLLCCLLQFWKHFEFKSSVHGHGRYAQTRLLRWKYPYYPRWELWHVATKLLPDCAQAHESVLHHMYCLWWDLSDPSIL